MRKNHFYPFLLLVFSFLLSNCATIVSKSSYPVSIATTPSGAQVSITDKKGKEIFKGTSPATIKLKAGAGYFSRAEYQVRMSAPGYDEKILPITFKLNGWYFGNLLIGGVIGMLIIDPASGAMWRIDTGMDNIYETLRATTTVSSASLEILDVKNVPPHLVKHLVKLK